MRKPSKIPPFLSPSPVGLKATYKPLHAASATNVKIMDVTANGTGGISPPFDNALRKIARGMETPHAGSSDLDMSPMLAVALLVYAPKRGEAANHPASR